MIVIWSDERTRFEAITSFLEKDIPKENRWRWSPDVKRWYAPTEDIARRLSSFAQGVAVHRLSLLSDSDRDALSASQAQDSDIAVPTPPGLDYLPYQRAGIAYALSRPHTLIADEMGLGKTIQAIGVVNVLAAERHRVRNLQGGDDRVRDTGDHVADLVHCELGVGVEHGRDSGLSRCACGDRLVRGPCTCGADLRDPVRRVLIVCPASLRLNWRAEWLRWHTGKLRPHLLDVWPGGGLFDETEGKAMIVSYDSVQKWHPNIARTDFDVLILDEAHLVKDEQTRRAKTIFGGKYRGTAFLPIRARRKLFLTGTAIVNSATDLWPLVKSLAPEGLGKSHADFVERYGAKNGTPPKLDELHLRLRSQIMVRRLKADVLKQLPAKRRQLVLLDVANAAAVVGAEKRALDEMRVLLAAVRAEIEKLPHAEQVMRLRQCRGMALSEIARIRHETALLKLPAAIEHIHDVLANVPKAIVFAHHLDVLDGLKAEFARISVGFDGRNDERSRQDAIDRFQKDRTARLFIGGMMAAGMGITLTAAGTVVFVELDWTPKTMMQCEDRAHRIGQHNPVLAQHLVIDGSIDAKMSRILIDKQAVMDAALDGHATEMAQKDILSEVLR